MTATTILALLVVYSKAYKAVCERVGCTKSRPKTFSFSSRASGNLITLMDDPETVRAYICVCSIKDRYYKYFEYRNLHVYQKNEESIQQRTNHGSFFLLCMLTKKRRIDLTREQRQRTQGGHGDERVAHHQYKLLTNLY
ncbi:hypothetical protein ACJX0J_032708 [Zea mays]